MMTAAETFYRHLDGCEQCRTQPFNLCVVGAIWLKKAADELKNTSAMRFIRTKEEAQSNG